MTPIITAFVGAVVVLAGALVARNATRYAAELDAAQRRRDAELAHLGELRDAFRPIGAMLVAVDSPHDAAMRIDENPQILDTFVATLTAHHRNLLQSYPVTPR